MASERLTNSDRDNIAKNIIAPILKEADKEIENFSKFVDEFLKKNLPKDVLEFSEKHLNLLKRRTHFYFSDFSALRLNCISTYIKVSYYIPECFNENQIYSTLRNSTEAKIFAKKMKALDEKAVMIKNKTRCALEHINTTKKLKESFPEAYAILFDVTVKEVKDNECDSIENLRAELSKLK